MKQIESYFILSRKQTDGSFTNLNIGDGKFPIVFTSMEKARVQAAAMFKEGVKAIERTNAKIAAQNVDDPRARVKPLTVDGMKIYIRKLKVVGKSCLKKSEQSAKQSRNQLGHWRTVEAILINCKKIASAPPPRFPDEWAEENLKLPKGSAEPKI